MIRLQDGIGLGADDDYLLPLHRIRPQLADRGIVFDPSGGDVLFADSAAVSHVDPDEGGPPLVLYDQCDGAFLWWMFDPRGDLARRWLLSGRVLGLFKVSRYRELAAYDAPSDDERLHVRKVRRLCPDRVAPFPSPHGPTLGAASAKILLSHGYWAFDVCAPQTEPVDLDAPRPLDVFCAVTVDYSCPAISWHRRQALARVSDLPWRSFVGRGRVLPEATYHELMRRARICASPWGWGETSYRDYEALLAGCVLIKPRTDFIDSLLPLDDRHYVACEPDFSDLAERVDEVLGNWHAYRDRREAAREYVLDARRPEWLADRWAETLRAAVEPAAARPSPLTPR